MITLKLILRNVLSHKLRTLLTTLAIAISVCTVADGLREIGQG